MLFNLKELGISYLLKNNLTLDYLLLKMFRCKLKLHKEEIYYLKDHHPKMLWPTMELKFKDQMGLWLTKWVMAMSSSTVRGLSRPAP